MNERCNHLSLTIMRFFRDHGVMPTLIKAHPEFFRRAMIEKEALQRLEYRGADWHFEGIRVEETSDVHAVECSQSDRGAE